MVSSVTVTKSFTGRSVRTGDGGGCAGVAGAGFGVCACPVRATAHTRATLTTKVLTVIALPLVKTEFPRKSRDDPPAAIGLSRGSRRGGVDVGRTVRSRSRK